MRLRLLAVTLLLAGCGQTDPTLLPTATPTPDASAATPSASPAETAVAVPGRPYDGEAILEAMAASVRPGGVPEELQSAEVAQAVAQQVWTFDGEPWETMAVSGSCGATTCTLEVAGSADRAVGEDVWVFEVDPAAPSVELETAELQSLPEAVVEQVDERARTALGDALEPELDLASVSWLAPDAGRYRLAYRDAGEEGSCRLDVVFDTARDDIVEQQSEDC